MGCIYIYMELTRVVETSKKQTIQGLREGVVDESETSVAPSLIKSFLYGSQQIKDEQAEMEQSFSKMLMRGKYVHEIVTHKVKPSKAAEYLDVVTEMYPKIASDPANKVHLVGSWRTVVGDMDTYSMFIGK